MARHNMNLHMTRLVLTIFVLFAAISNNIVLAEQGNQAGFAVAAAVQGEVELMAAGSPGNRASIKSGHFIYPGDRLLTGNNGTLQLLLSDGTVFTLGNKTDFSLVEYHYDPVALDGAIRAQVENGSFKIVTGRIGEAHPGNVSITMPTGTVNLRGTIVAGETDGEEDTVVLLGPGAQKNSADKKGSFAFIPKGAAVQTEEDEILVYKAGYAVTVDPDGNVSEPFEMSGRDFGQLVSSLAREHRGNGSGEEVVEDDESAGELAGDDGTDLGENEIAENEEHEYEDEVEESEQDKHDDFDALLEAQDITKIADLEDITGLKGKFVEEDVAMLVDGKKDKTGKNTFDFRFEFGSEEPAKFDFIGFENIHTEDENGVLIEKGEVSWDVAVDGEPEFEELDLSTEDETLVAKHDCIEACEGSVTVLNAGEGNVAKFFLLDLETETATFHDKLVKPGGNNNFPGSDEEHEENDES